MISNLLFDEIPAQATEEVFHTLLLKPGLRIERIVSIGHAGIPDKWYDQAQAEWVIVLAGEAWFRFQDESEARCLRPGDFVDISRHRLHRVESTDPDQPTIWLAIHYE